jgi:hypothetical protein
MELMTGRVWIEEKRVGWRCVMWNYVKRGPGRFWKAIIGLGAICFP